MGRGFLTDPFHWLSSQGRRRRLTQRLIAARRSGHGLFLHEWRLSADAVPHSLTEWCRETLSGCRRPWGIGQFDLTIAVSEAEAPGLARTLRLRRLEPSELWSPDGLESRLSGLLPAPSLTEPGLLHVAAALFSWGEAAHRAAG